MKKILFIAGGRDTSCSFYRAGGVSKSLRKVSGYDIQVQGWREVGKGWQSIQDYDIIMIHGAYTKDILVYAEHVKSCGVPLWLDYDDDYLSVPPENRAWPVFSNPAVRKQIEAFYKIADVISVTNEHLKSTMSEYNDNIWVIPNAFNDSIFDVNRKLPERQKMVFWRGSDTHIFDLTQQAVSINKITQDNLDWNFTYMGYNPWFLAKEKNITFIPALDTIDFFHSAFDLAPTIMQIPLFDSSFNRSKADIAFIEGAYWGAVCIVPKFWGDIPGTLSYSDLNTYEKQLTKSIDGTLDLEIMREQAWQHVKDNLLLSDINKLRYNLMKELLDE